MRLRTQPSYVTIEVEDGSSLPPIVRIVERDRASGRGLRLVDELASAWGIEVLAEGKRVWFEHRHG